MTDPELDGGKDLLGGQEVPTPSADITANMLLTKGMLPHPGRTRGLLSDRSYWLDAVSKPAQSAVPTGDPFQAGLESS